MTEPVCKIHPNGGKEWWLNGKRHRTDGPAIELANGGKEWWLNGQFYSSEDKWKAALTPATCSGKIVEIEGRKYKLIEI